MKDNLENWYCSLPWTGFSNDPDGKVRPCCIYEGHITDDQGTPFYVQTATVDEIFTSTYMKDLRNQFRNNIKPKGCSTCIKNESIGVYSKREAYLNYETYDVEPIYPVEYQMILSNACNLKCRSCTPSHSNTWQAEFKDLFGDTGYKMPLSQPSHRDSVLWKDRKNWMKSVERLEIVGGEPFYISQWQVLWKELVNLGYSKKISMDMSTNGTIYGGNILETLIPHFSRIGLGLSIDGLDLVFEYLRHPGKWKETEQNILKYNSLLQKYPHNFQISFAHTIGWINAWYLPEFHDWVNKNTPSIPIWNNIIHWPQHMSLTSLPLEAKELINSKWSKYDWGHYQNNINGITNFMYSKTPSKDEIKNMYNTFKIHDQYRNETVSSVIPKELMPILKDYIN